MNIDIVDKLESIALMQNAFSTRECMKKAAREIRTLRQQLAQQPSVDVLVEALKCPNCDDIGWFAEYSRNGEPEQCQCEFCYTIPNSIFNLRNAIDKAMNEAKPIEKEI